MKLQGNIIKGFGEGHFYVGKYAGLFKQKLGFLPFAGTLNLKVEKVPEFTNPITVTPGGKFKPVHCYKTKVRANGKEIEGALVVPEATRHPKDVLEIIAPVSIKETLNLKDGDPIECFLE